MIRYTDFYIGVDCGVTRDPSAIAVLSRCAPLPDDPTSGPVLEVADLASARAVPFTVVAREVKKIVNFLDGTVTVGLDSTGPGEGLAQELRRQGVRCIAFKMNGAGHRVIRRLDRWSVPSHVLYEHVYQLLVQRRLRINPAHPLTATLVQELDSCEVSYTANGGIRYEVPRSGGSHGDLLVAAGIAATLHETPWSSQVNMRARSRGPDRERRPGNRRRGEAARDVVDTRLNQSRAEAEAYMDAERRRFADAGWGTSTDAHDSLIK